MAKPFGKRPVDYLQNQQSQQFIKELSKVRKSTLTDLVKVTKGGNNPGTWMHEDLAIEFARWLILEFKRGRNLVRELLNNFGEQTLESNRKVWIYRKSRF
ncbi:KilA-N domain-containing protein [Epilithonimonas sp. FP105]|nr:KilA-N domain-containing protein [Epilithonimonas sp. FP105]